MGRGRWSFRERRTCSAASCGRRPSSGAAILTTLATAAGRMPSMTVGAVGYGAGTMELPGTPNVLRCLVREAAELGGGDPHDAGDGRGADAVDDGRCRGVWGGDDGASGNAERAPLLRGGGGRARGRRSSRRWRRPRGGCRR